VIDEDPEDIDFPWTCYIEDMEEITVTQEEWQKAANIMDEKTELEAARTILQRIAK
jgi:hypothetical protein